ncbi:MAG: bifunctional transaldolase/phosoglucose isomerase [Anaerolineales bacterium]|jgi:transaldolase/glucose-6-phosphate isomerase
MDKKKNPLLKLEEYGQSIWLDFLRRGMIESGEIQQLIDEDGLSGITSNPKIFDKAIAGSHDYDEAVKTLALEGKEAVEIYKKLAVEDVRNAADLLRPTYDQTGGGDGFVSLEVSPHLAHDTQGTIEEAHELWSAVDRPNIFIKVPATVEGLDAIEELISEGINVNVTLLFGLPRYRKVAAAYIAGLQKRLDNGEPIDHIASVASFFLSRIDVLVDPILEKMMDQGGSKGETAEQLHGQVAIASAKIAYQIYHEIFDGPQFQELEQNGAARQRLLWASTSTKNPAYSDVKYVDTLIGPKTVNTIPLETLNAYRDHGDPALRLEQNVEKANWVLEQLEQVGIDIDEVTQQLEDEGVDKFNKPFDRLMETLEDKRKEAFEEPVDRQELRLGKYREDVERRIASLEEEDFIFRLWRKDPSAWKTDPQDQQVISNALGWLHVAEKMQENLKDLMDFVDEVKQAGFHHVVHMGMGGSSLAPMVFAKTFGQSDRGLPLTVLDTTDPATVKSIQEKMPLADTLFIVASKSGKTAETLAYGDYFYEQLKLQKGEDRAGENFVVITDPGTPLQKLAKERGYRRTFLNFKDIGGRYSALSYFGLVPAALHGVDVAEILERAMRMEHACASCVDGKRNPGLVLGAVMGELQQQGKDKLTFLVDDRIETFGMWLEQLLAESTGKEGTGILPVAGEPVGNPEDYGDDRLFVYIHFDDHKSEAMADRLDALTKAGYPLVSICLDDVLDLGQEYFRWEVATATAGAIIGINAFNQPNVQESKDNTSRLLKQVESEGHLPAQEPDLEEDGLSLYGVKQADSIESALSQFFSKAQDGDYFALMAYLTEEQSTTEALNAIRERVRDGLHLATTLGYGPRFLHSTGQFHKGGPNTGLFLQLTAGVEEDVAIPGEKYSFGVLKRAQAQGDLQALHKHDRRAIRIHLGEHVQDGLDRLKERVDSVLKEEV